MYRDSEGFSYPVVDTAVCIKCGLCERTCPMDKTSERQEPLATYAATNPDISVLLKSASGGVFSALATVILNDGGIVFGARFDKKWQAVHDYASSIEDIDKFRGSKYTQSIIGDSYRQAECFLKSNRKVMFSGTPCQIAGLRNYLRKPYPGLLFTIEIICHGVPSPLIWDEYLKSITSLDNADAVECINMRDKRHGWIDYSISISFGKDNRQENVNEPAGTNKFMQGFIKNLYSRPSCYSCRFKSGKSGADITIGDYWGINACHPELYNPSGVSAVLIRTDNGALLYEQSNLKSVRTSYEDVLSGNPVIENSPAPDSLRDYFWENYHNVGFRAIDMTLKKSMPSNIEIITSKFRTLINKLIKH